MISLKDRIRLVTSSSLLVKTLPFELKAIYLKQNILQTKDAGITNEKYLDRDVVISLTTYGKRIYTVALAIESLMEQTLKANKIVLWLDYSFKNKMLPMSLRMLQDRGLTVKYCEDIKSYKKLIPALKAYPDSIIITTDDDLLYEYDFIEKLVAGYKANPKIIHCNRIHKMTLSANKELLPYDEWQFECTEIDKPDILNFATGCGGILYPPNVFSENVFDENTFMSICPSADDVWFKAMTMLTGTLVSKVYTHNKSGQDYIIIPEGQDMALSLENNGNKKNDTQIRAVFDKYNLYKKLH